MYPRIFFYVCPFCNSTCTAKIPCLKLVISTKNQYALQVSWEIVGPNSQEVLLPQNGDIEDPVSGTVSFREGEGGQKTIIVTVCPHEETEAEETFIVQLKPLKDAKLDRRAKAVAITVSLNAFEKHFGFNGFIRKLFLLLETC